MKSERKSLLAALSKMKSEGFDYLVKITAIDYVDHMDVVYMIRSIGDIESSKDEIVELSLKPTDLWLPTVTNIFPAADWYEREMSEMFGIDIKGRNASRLLLEKWDGTGYPLRKSFAWDAPYKTSEDKK